ncbi:MAG TPA: hypothetical protein VEJ63_17705 [Planctomycetota bacterium]|nr:hypothetical protein [Planctomycetota bacterium]
MSILLLPLFILSLIGLFLSIISHLAGLIGYEAPLGSASWWLHVGIFVIWFPAVLCAQRLVKDFKQKDFWKAALRGCPPWMRYVTYGFFIYAMINFILFIGATPAKGSHHASDAPPEVIRGFSGHWMAFYSVGAAILYSSIQVAKRDPARRCNSGHPVGPAAKFCESCGAPVPDDNRSAPEW